MPPIVGRIDEEAFGIAGICGCWSVHPKEALGIAGGRRSGHRAQSVVAKQLVRIPKAVDMNKERCQVTRCRDPAAVRIHPGDIHSVGIAPCLIIVFDFVGRPLLQRISGNPHITDIAMSQNIVFDVLLVRLTGKFFDHAPEYTIAEVRVASGMWLELS